MNGQLMNPRDIATGQETWGGSSLDWQAFQQGGPGISHAPGMNGNFVSTSQLHEAKQLIGYDAQGNPITKGTGEYWTTQSTAWRWNSSQSFFKQDDGINWPDPKGWTNTLLSRIGEGINYAGGTIGSLEQLVINGEKGAQQWLGANGKYYSTSWGGNQYTGARSVAVSAARAYKIVGYGLTAVGTITSLSQALYNGGSNRDFAKFGASVGFTVIATALGGPVGLAVGLGLGYLDSKGYFDSMYGLVNDKKRW